MNKNHEFKILVVDDDPDLLRITERLLKEQHYTVITAVSGQECLQAIRLDKPDLLLLDVMLPDMSGIDICKTIKNDPQLASIFVLLLSGMKTQSENIAEGLETGADGYLIKPLQKREFLARVDAATRTIRAEKTLRESEEKYRLLLEGSILGILAFDIETQRCSFANTAACKLFGYRKEEITRLNLADFHPSDSIEMVINEFHAQGRGDKSLSNNLPCLRNDGSIFYADIAGYSTVINGRNCSIGFIMDVTERKQAEVALKKSETRFRSIINVSPVPMALNDEQQNITFLNPAFVQTFGYTLEDIPTLAHWWPQAYPDREYRQWLADIWQAGIEHVKQTGEAFTPIEITVRCKNGTSKTVLASASLFSKSFERDHLVILYDITDRKRAEEELTSQKHFFEQMFMQSSVSTQILDHEGWCERINPKLGEIFGVKPHNIEGRIYNIFQDEAIIQGGVIPYLKRAFHEGKAAEWEIFFDIGVAADSQNIEVEDKKKVWYHNWAYPIFDKNEKISHVIIQHHNITERKQMIASLEEALVKAEAGNRLKTAFMNNISHEIRTPLNGILGFSSLIVQPDITDKEKEQFDSFIITSSNRLLNTVTAYMDISMIASGTMEVKRKPIDLHQILYQLLNQFQSWCTGKNIGLYLDIPEKIKNITLHADEELLQKILSHILDNAVKFTNQGRITFGYVLQPGSCEFFVKDTGIGISKESLSLVFESFIQEELSPTRAHEGSGLGLSIAQGLVRLLGGKMRAESEKGNGSTFFFTIPFEGMMETLVMLESEKTAVPVLDKPVILIAEDDESNRFYLEKILTSGSVKVFSATNGKEAVEQCRAHPEISLVLMDLKMPVMDGFEATCEIKTFCKDLPIIALTAFAMSGDKKRALEAGCNDYLSKPVTREVLFDKLKKYGVSV